MSHPLPSLFDLDLAMKYSLLLVLGVAAQIYTAAAYPGGSQMYAESLKADHLDKGAPAHPLHADRLVGNI